MCEGQHTYNLCTIGKVGIDIHVCPLGTCVLPENMFKIVLSEALLVAPTWYCQLLRHTCTNCTINFLQILREVKALASLQHHNIVGYNGAWLEYGSVKLPKKTSK